MTPSFMPAPLQWPSQWACKEKNIEEWPMKWFNRGEEKQQNKCLSEITKKARWETNCERRRGGKNRCVVAPTTRHARQQRSHKFCWMRAVSRKVTRFSRENGDLSYVLAPLVVSTKIPAWFLSRNTDRFLNTSGTLENRGHIQHSISHYIYIYIYL